MPDAQTKEIVSFASFKFIANERLLLKDGAPVELGARAFDILAALLSRPNQVVSKGDLLALVWPNVTVEEGSLRFHMANLRKVLGDGNDGAHYITTVAGRGYCFVARVSRWSDRSRMPPVSAFSHANLPDRLEGMVGRDDDVVKLSALLTSKRIVTIVGSGGVGKTTAAIAVGHHMIGAFSGDVLMADLSMLNAPNQVATALASILGLSVPFDDATSGLTAYLRDKRILLILDTCEHLIEAVAALTSTILMAAHQVHILATSRETLQVEGENVYRLDPLACPPTGVGITAAFAQTFPAPKLFVERAVASGAQLDFSDAEAAIVVAICRKLDGVALAIELAARQVGAHGMHQTAAQLDQQLTLLWVGPRTAPQRQKTLQATLDWSCGLLSEAERRVLRRLAVFVGHFPLDAALAVVTSPAINASLVLAAIDSLAGKSMIATSPSGATIRYRLLDTTRAYALHLETDDTETAALPVRHAGYYRQWLEQAGGGWSAVMSGPDRTLYFAGLNNVRAALEWCFGANGDAEIGIGLAVAAAPLFLAISLLTECQRWSEKALHALDDIARGSAEEMRLQATLGMSLTFLHGMSDAARVALDRSLAIAEARGDTLNKLQLLGQLHMFHVRTGNFNAALQCARRSTDVSRNLLDPAATGLARCFLGISLSYLCDLDDARVEIEKALLHGGGGRTHQVSLGFDHTNMAAAYLARTLWLQGYPVQAIDRARQTVKDAAGLGHPITLCIALMWAVSVFLWTGDLQSAEDHVDWLASLAENYSLAPYIALGHGYKGELVIRRGNPGAGVEMLRSCLEDLLHARHAVLATPFKIALAEGLAAIGQCAEGLALLDEIGRLVEANGDLCYMPEVLRVKGVLLLSMPSAHEAEKCFRQSLELSRRKRARAWELRTTNDLVALMISQGHRDAARSLLQPVFRQFQEGLETEDLKVAESLLVSLG
jgi:predicted ATPase/DNA-binding winged helix-turn-helix (wHTH) protein